MSLMYRILKPIVRKFIKGSSVHREDSYEEFKQASYDIQKKFRFSLPKTEDLSFTMSSSTDIKLLSEEKREQFPTRLLCISRAEVQEGGSYRIKAP